MLMHLDPFDLLIIAMTAARRSAIKDALRTQSNKFNSDRTEFETHYVGFIGEFVVAKALGVDADRSVMVGSDNGVDLMFRNASIQVKTTAYVGKEPEIKFNDLSDFKTDIAAGVQILSPLRCVIMGWISRDDFVFNHKVKNYGYGDRAVVGQKNISPIETLINS